MLSHPIADSGDDGVEVLDFAFQQHHPGTFSAVGDRMVEQHVEEVAELGRDAAVLQGVKISDGSHVGMTKNKPEFLEVTHKREGNKSTSVSLIVFF